jgi:hypothetical protein
MWKQLLKTTWIYWDRDTKQPAMQLVPPSRHSTYWLATVKGKPWGKFYNPELGKALLESHWNLLKLDTNTK